MQPANRPQRVEIAMRFIEVLFAWQGEPTGKDTPVGGGQKFEVGGQNVPAGTYLRFVKVFLQEHLRVLKCTYNKCNSPINPMDCDACAMPKYRHLRARTGKMEFSRCIVVRKADFGLRALAFRPRSTKQAKRLQFPCSVCAWGRPVSRENERTLFWGSDISGYFRHRSVAERI